MKRYNWEIIVYDIKTYETLEAYLLMERINYACAFHDKDINEDGTPKKPHVHFMIFFPWQRTDTSISKKLGIPLNCFKYIDNKVGAVRYLIHLDHKDKYQYDKDIIISNFDIDYCFTTKKDKSTREGTNVMQLIDFIKQKNYTTLEDLVTYAVDNGLYSDLRRNQNILLKIMYDRH